MSDPRPASRPLPPVAIVIGVLFFFGLLGLMIYGVMKSGAPDRDVLPSALIGKPAPAFELPVLHDPQIKVSSTELRGAPYVLNVWGSWCAACRDEHPILTRFAETKRVRVIGYNWKDEPADALRWLEQLGNPFVLVLSDIEGRTAIDWGVTAAPETFLVDASGVVRWKYSGALSQRVIDTQLIPELEKVERAHADAQPQLPDSP
ncbi:DsbE family thiol:disulfide interchange protein [Stenotrophomonas sp. RG-453]|uniref:DsbE family thiol:disulfide interchange protein n=1 Tax=Stenotrophomonas sp. RG-453 TaxID=2957502 RepID=UPI0029C9C1D0|nr:DsbE family thiol:disulfide interchange protein [Stenotrophomonas sp. RG-453]MDX5516048.1 DsbE family thiol:disulfide interchange protein [Stenotrophomonas sp. RG-453]